MNTLKTKMDLSNIQNHVKTINITNMLIWAIELKCFNSAKKILNSYPQEQINNIEFSFIYAYFTKTKGIKRIFELLKPLIDFDKIDVETALCGIYWGADRKKYNRDVLLFLFKNAKFTDIFKGGMQYHELNSYLNN